MISYDKILILWVECTSSDYNQLHGKIKFAEYVSKHPEEFKNAFESNFKRIFDIIDNI